MREWKDEFCSFNSWKGLLYKQWYDAILWGKFLPPVEVNLDPVNDCNLDCIWCNNKAVKSRGVKMGTQHMMKLIKFYKDWGVKGLCIAGGGEPTLHQDLDAALYYARALSLPVSMLTNGLFMDDPQLKSAALTCRWIGVSVDCANRVTYKELKGKDRYKEACDNIRSLVDYGAKEVTYKFLLHPKNQYEVFRAIEKAKNLGCHGIHIRPISFKNFQAIEDVYDIKAIERQVNSGREQLENDDFKIFYIQHKYDKDLHTKFGFSKCQATPLIAIFEANGDITLCLDRKNDPRMVIGKHNDIDNIPIIWGGIQHKKVIKNIKLSECPKCTLNSYQKQIEFAIEENKMDWEFV